MLDAAPPSRDLNRTPVVVPPLKPRQVSWAGDGCPFPSPRGGIGPRRSLPPRSPVGGTATRLPPPPPHLRRVTHITAAAPHRPARKDGRPGTAAAPRGCSGAGGECAAAALGSAGGPAGRLATGGGSGRRIASLPPALPPATSARRWERSFAPLNAGLSPGRPCGVRKLEGRWLVCAFVWGFCCVLVFYFFFF